MKFIREHATAIKWISWIGLALAMWPLSPGRFFIATGFACLYGIGCRFED